MKKHTLYYIALSALAMLTGCSNEENFGLKPTDGNRSLTATIEQNDLSRTAVSEEGQVTWTETDAIGVFGTASQNIRFTYQSSTDNGNSATFRGDFPEEETMEQAYYPYQEDATLSGNALTLHLPSEYTYTGNSNAPMLGVKNNDGTFTFKHLCGLMQVKLTSIPSKSAQFVITSEGETIAGTAVVDNIDASNATLHIKENEQASNTITYHINSTDFTEEGLTFHIPLPVGEYEKLTVMLKDESNNILFQKSISNATIKRAVILSMPILDCENNISYVLNEQTIQLNKQDESYIESVTEEGDGTSDENANTVLPKIFIYHIPDETDSEIKKEISNTANPDNNTEEQTPKIIISDDVTADTSGIEPEQEDIVEDYELDDMYTDVLKGYAEYDEGEEDAVSLDDYDNFLTIDIKQPSKVEGGKYSGAKNSFLKSPELFTKYNKMEYSIAPLSNTNTAKMGNFSIGTTYDQGIDYAEFEQSTGIFSRYDTKYFAVSSAYKKTINSTNNNYNDKFTFAPELKINQYFTLRETLSADIVKNIRQAEFTISINPFGNRDLDRLRFELGTNSIFDGKNTLLKKNLTFRKNFFTVAGS